ncbi:MAG: PAS domain S-box protein [Candidatus Hodarchaeota archaeon]
MLSIIQEYGNHLEEIFENSFDYIYLHDKKGNIIDVNNIIIQNLGYSKKEILKMKVTDFLVEEISSEISYEIKRALENGIVNKPKIYKVRKKDGNFIYVEANAIPLKKNGKYYAILGIGHDVTTYIDVEQKLHESNEKYQHLFNETPFQISLFDLEGNLVETNKKIIDKLSEYAKIDFKGRNFIEIASYFKNSKQIIELFLNRFKELREGKPLKPIELKLITKDGKEIWLYWQSSIVKTKKNNYIQVIMQDMTEQKEAERRLAESEGTYRLITENANDLIRVLNDRFEIEYLNESAHSRALGYSKEELIDKPAIFLNHPEDYAIIRRLMRKMFKIGETTHESRLRHKSGKYIWFEIKAKIFKDEQSNTKYLFVSREITERKVAEEKLKESEEKFRNIAEQSFMGIIIIQNGEIKYMNKTISKISGFPIEEILNWSIKDLLKWIYPDDIPAIMERVKKNKENRMSAFSHNFFRVINKNGEIRWLEDYTSKIVFQGNPANLISLIDITDKKEAEKLIIEENERLQELHELRKDLITRVSHELKTPMTSIYGANQIILKLYMDQIGEEAQKYIEIGHRGSLRMKQLIDNLLDVSRLEAKRFELNLQKENLVELLVDCVKDMNYLATNRQLRIKLDLPDQLFLNIDRLRFRQVFTNLISNAIKNTPRDGEIFINLVEHVESINIHIKDTGIGLTEKEKEKLFQKFGKIERYGMNLDVDIEGSGLGLFISKEIVELHGGQIFVESKGRNMGTTFSIRLYKD